MKPLNTLPIEMFLEKARIAKKSGQKTLVMNINDAEMLSESLAGVMTRLSGKLDELITTAGQQEQIIDIQMDGGGFK